MQNDQAAAGSCGGPDARPFLVGITSDFESHARGVLEPALEAVLAPAGICCETMPDTGGADR